MIKWLVHQKNLTLNVYALNNRTNYKAKTDIKEKQFKNNTDFNTPLSISDRAI